MDLCAFPHPRTGVLLEVCPGCYVLEETRRLASRRRERTAFYQRFLARANALYVEVRTALVAEDDGSTVFGDEGSTASDDGSSAR